MSASDAATAGNSNRCRKVILVGCNPVNGECSREASSTAPSPGRSAATDASARSSPQTAARTSIKNLMPSRIKTVKILRAAFDKWRIDKQLKAKQAKDKK